MNCYINEKQAKAFIVATMKISAKFNEPKLVAQVQKVPFSVWNNMFGQYVSIKPKNPDDDAFYRIRIPHFFDYPQEVQDAIEEFAKSQGINGYNMIPDGSIEYAFYGA